MASIQEVVRRLKIESTASSIAQTTEDLRAMGKAHSDLAVASQTTEKATQSLDGKFASLERRYNATLRAQQDYEKVQRQVNAAVAQNPALAERANAVLAAAAQRYEQASTGAKALTAATQGISTQLVALSAGAGPAGVFLSALGPWGIAGAVGIGAASSALSFFMDIAKQTGERALEMRNFAESTGFAIDEIRALKSVATSIGIDTEKVQQWAERMGKSLSDVRDGVGPLADRIHAISPDLLVQIQLTRTNAQAWDLLAKAAAGAGLSTQKFLSEIAGKGSAQLGLLFGATERAGGLQNIASKTKDASDATAELYQHWADVQIQINEAEKRINKLYSVAFPGLLDEQLKVKQAQERIAGSVVEMANGWRLFVNNIQATPQELEQVESAADAAAARLAARYRRPGTNVTVLPSRSDASVQHDMSLQEGATPASAITASAVASEKLAASQEKVALSALQIYNNTKRDIDALGAAATIQEKYDLAIKKADADLQQHVLTQAGYNRVIASAGLEKRIAIETLRIGQLGELASVTELNKQKEDALQKSINDGARYSASELAAIRERNKLLTESSKIENQMVFERQQLFKSQVDQSIDATLRAAGIPPASERAAAIRDYMRMTDVLKDMKDSGAEFAKSFVSGMMAGKSMIDALAGAFDQLARKMADKAIDSLMNGEFEKAAVQAIIAIGAAVVNALLGIDKAKDAAAVKEHEAIMAANERAASYRIRAHQAGADTSTLAGALAVFDENAANERNIEIAKNGMRAVGDLDQALAAERLAIINKFNADAIAAEKQAHADRLALLDTAQRQINDATGKGFLNQFTDLFKQVDQVRQASLAEGGDGSIANLLLGASAQKIVDDAGLVGDSFNDLLKTFPNLTGLVHESTSAIQAQVDAEKERIAALNQSARTIVDYINGLQGGQSSTLSPAARLAAAQSTYNSQIGLAAGGNTDALASITKYAEDLRTAAAAYYGSGAGYQAIFAQIKSQLIGLPAVQQSTDPVVAALRDVITAVNTASTVAAKDTTVQQTKAAIDTANSLQASANSLANSAVSLQSTSNSLLDQIRSLNQTSFDTLQIIKDQTTSHGFTTTPNAIHLGDPVPTPSQNVISTALDKIVFNTATTAFNTGLIAQAPNGSVFGRLTAAYAEGGVIPPYGLALVSEHSPGGGRFMRAGAEPITVSPYAPSGANDNSALLAEIRRLNDKVDRLTRELEFNTDVTSDGNNVNRIGHATTAGVVVKQTASIESEMRQDRNNPKAA